MKLSVNNDKNHNYTEQNITFYLATVSKKESSCYHRRKLKDAFRLQA